MSYRKLNQEEIESLQKNGCYAKFWDKIQVKDGFKPEHVHDVYFSGIVTLGNFQSEMEIGNGILRQCGLYNSRIQNCSIGDDVYISDVKLLANYGISNNVVIENVATLCVTGRTAFGNGLQIDVLNEGGGRELTIFDKLSAQIAYLMVLYRHDQEFITRLDKMITSYVDQQKSSYGVIGSGARICNCTTIRNVWIGQAAQIEGVMHLEEGTVGSNADDPVVIGAGVFAKDFIILSGSTVDSGALLTKCFVGQGVRIGRQFSAENSAFFANCEGFHSEACSLFAGPYTVTHHRSTLLIAGLCSFFNAGSGTNQSNHMYKLGPVHQGILERGSKTGSFSYLLWPSRVGAFTAVVGKHYANFDTTNFPFSYITEEDGKSILTPAMNLFTVGTKRDSQKWPNRDLRKDREKLDLLHFELFNPYVVGKIVCGMEWLQSLYENTPRDKEFVLCEGIHIRRLMLKTSRKYYDLVIKIFLGNQLLKRISGFGEKVTYEEIMSRITKTTEVDFQWVDMVGLFAPKNDVEALMKSVCENKINNINSLSEGLKKLFDGYDEAAWAWCVQLLEKRLDLKISEISREQLAQLVSEWKDSSLKLNNMTIKDAQKEFDSNSKTGFGIDGDHANRDIDFKEVRGTFDENSFVKRLQAESQEIEEIASRWLSILI